MRTWTYILTGRARDDIDRILTSTEAVLITDNTAGASTRQLEELADSWENEALSSSHSVATAYRICADELRKTLREHNTQKGQTA
jgi:plasmid stabilization system protein ParE